MNNFRYIFEDRFTVPRQQREIKTHEKNYG